MNISSGFWLDKRPLHFVLYSVGFPSWVDHGGDSEKAGKVIHHVFPAKPMK